MTKPAHHRPDGRFRNPPGSPRREASLADFLAFLGKQIRAGFTPPKLPDQYVLTRAAVLDGLNELGDRDGITWLGHAAFLIQAGGKRFLTDPYLGKVAGPKGVGPIRFTPPALAPEELPPLDAILLSHDHYDHLCLDTLDRLPGKGQITAFAPLRTGHHFRQRGFGDVIEMDWWQTHEFGGVTVQALPNIHFSGRGAFNRNRTLWMAFGLKAASSRIFFGGDSAYGAVFKEIGEKAGPFDLALVGIGAYSPRPIMVASHATPEEALDMAADLGAAHAIGMHWGTIALTDEPVLEPPERFLAAAKARGLEHSSHILPIGGSMAVPGLWPRN